MPIPVACRCGKSFAANDNLAGKTVKCPGCQQPLAIPAPGQPAAKGDSAPKAGAQPAGNGKLAAACKCGAKFAAPAELAGKQVKCPKCGEALTVGAAPRPAAAPQPQAATSQNAAAPIPITCTCKCGARFGAKPELRGRTVKCPKCSQPLVVGASASALAAQTVPAPATPSTPAGGGFGLDDLFDEIGLQPKARGENACPSCSAELAPEAVLCVHCGFDRQKGKKIQVETIKKVESKKLGPPSGAAKAGKKSSSSLNISAAFQSTAVRFSVLGIALAVLVSGCFFPLVYVIPAFIGWAIGFVGSIKFLIIANEESPVQLLLVLFVPFYSLFYMVTRWSACKESVLLQVVGMAVCFGSIMAMSVLGLMSSISFSG